MSSTRSVNIALVNRSLLITDADLGRALKAFQFQLNEHFAPHWGTWATLHLVGRNGALPSAMWWQVVVDTPEEPGVLGFGETTADGLPIGFTAVKPSIDAGVPWSLVLGHELLETIVDPYLNSLVQMPAGVITPSPAYAFYDVCDWIGAAGYQSLGVTVPDFVLPFGFGGPDTKEGDGRYSLLGTISAPFTIAPSGLLFAIDGAGKFQQFVGSDTKISQIEKSTLSRRTRRLKKLGLI